MSSYTLSAAFALLCLAILVAQAVWLIVLNVRDRRAAREAAKRDRLDTMMRLGLCAALFNGWVDEHGNLIERVGEWDDIR